MGIVHGAGGQVGNEAMITASMWRMSPEAYLLAMHMAEGEGDEEDDGDEAVSAPLDADQQAQVDEQRTIRSEAVERFRTMRSSGTAACGCGWFPAGRCERPSPAHERTSERKTPC
jgi:hypothetical protein